MTISMYQVAVPVFVRALGNLAHVLKKGEEHAKSKNVSDEVLLQTRLIPDMLPLIKQIQIACDMATRGAARLAGVEHYRQVPVEPARDLRQQLLRHLLESGRLPAASADWARTLAELGALFQPLWSARQLPWLNAAGPQLLLQCLECTAP